MPSGSRRPKPINEAFAAMERRLEAELANSTLQSRAERKEKQTEYTTNLRDLMVRKWLVKTGKEDRLDFNDEEKKKLRDCFMQLDDDGSGSIGIGELEEPLIGLGFAERREDVEAMILAVDDPEDPNGCIEFEEFL